MATINVAASCNYDLCSGQTTGATIDVFNVTAGQLLVDTDTKFCSGHTTNTVSNGSLDSVTIAATAVDGELKFDGKNVKIIPRIKSFEFIAKYSHTKYTYTNRYCYIS